MSRHRLTVAGFAALVGLTVGPIMTPPADLVAQGNIRAAGIQYTSIPGFTVERMTPADAPQSYISMTFDASGRVVAGRRDGPIVTFTDTTGDGLFDSETVVSDAVAGCMGLWYDGPTLYAVCSDLDEGAPGMFRLRDANADRVMDTFERFSPLRNRTGSHGPHAIRRGPDGIPTFISGNRSGPPPERWESSSPYAPSEEWQFLDRFTDARGHCSDCMAPGATISRVNVETGTYSILTAGMRNPYDHTYNLAGEMFAFDADMEWDLGLPWYRAIRTVHAIPGGEMGWRNGSGKWPDYYLDSLPPVREIGRGSPVGVESYQSFLYPREFYDALLEADYSRGRLLWTPLVRRGATYEALNERAELVHGEPLPITDLEVGPDGMVYFTTLGAEGGVYRLRYDWAEPRVEPEGVLAIVRQPQPLSSWGWAAIEARRASMGPAFAAELEALARDAAAAAADRAMAVLMLQRHGASPSAALLGDLIADADADVRAAVVYVAGVHDTPAARTVAAGALRDADALVRRRAAEALVRQGLDPNQPGAAPVSDLYDLLNDADRFVRYAGRLALQRTPRSEWSGRVLAETNPRGAIEGMVALVRTSTAPTDLDVVLEKQLTMMRDPSLTIENRLRLNRAFQLVAMEIPDGLRPELRRQVHDIVTSQFPAPDDRLNREFAKTLGYLAEPGAAAEILAAMPEGDDRQELQIEYINALRAIDTGWTDEQAQAVAAWFRRSMAWRGGASFAGYLNVLFNATVDGFTPAQQQVAYATVPEYAPLSPEELAAVLAEREADDSDPILAINTRGDAPPLDRFEILETVMFRGGLDGPPDLEAGQTVFEARCSTCHRFGDLGADFGPDLTTVSARYSMRDILDAVLFPSATINTQYISTLLELESGQILNVMVMDENDATLTVRSADVQQVVQVPKADVTLRYESDRSIMPEGLIDDLDRDTIRNLVGFLQSDAPERAAAAGR